MPALTGLLADSKGWNIAMVIPLIFYFVPLAFSVYVNTVAASELDGFRETKIGYTDADGAIGDIKREERMSVSHIEMNNLKGPGHVETAMKDL